MFLHSYVNRLFGMIPNVLKEMNHYDKSECDKGKRYKYLKTIYECGPKLYMKHLETNNHDFFDIQYNKCYLKDFAKEIELKEWILSGLSKNEQDDFFVTNNEVSDEEDFLDSP